MAFKEALRNAVKHSGAANVRLGISVQAGALRLSLEDNGRGFVEGPAQAGADGLRNMRERLRQLGGQCDIISAPGRGTKVLFPAVAPIQAQF